MNDIVSVIFSYVAVAAATTGIIHLIGITDGFQAIVAFALTLIVGAIVLVINTSGGDFEE